MSLRNRATTAQARASQTALRFAWTSDGSASAVRGLTLSGSLAIQWLLDEHLLEVDQGLGMYSCLLVVYLVFEIARMRARIRGRLFVSPVVLASVFGFALPFGLTNFIYFLPSDTFGRAGSIDVTPAMNDLMWLVLLAACCMWAGYDSGIARAIGRRIANSAFLGRAFSSGARVNRPAVLVCLGLSLAARAFEAQQGVLGYGDSDQLLALAPYREYLTVLDLLGRWALIALAIEYYGTPRPTTSQRVLLWGTLMYEVSLGFLTGFKSAALLPIGFVALASAGQRGRLPRWTGPVILTTLVAAYALVQPYRALSGEVGTRRSLLAVGTTMLQAQREASTSDDDPLLLQVVTRINLTYFASLGVAYARSGAPLPGNSPDFLGDILLAPIYAVIPRLLWDAKPLHDSGQWYTTYIVGVDSVSSTAMSAVTSLNFAAGVTGVTIGFLLVGLLQRSLSDGFGAFGAGGLMMLIALLPSVVVFEGALGPQIASLVRAVPILVVVQWLLFVPARTATTVSHLARVPIPT